ncbi:MAG TPA: S-layer homology domain-containing protein [Symbiobacteriaceae bacterium]|nr:S-layer homology domain-containing protein [Symbiobacteriaceae bacterium]
MRRLFPAVVALVMLLALVPVAAADDPFLTLGFLPPTSLRATTFIRGTAPAGMTVAISINGQLRARIIAGPSMSTYKQLVRLDPGDNRIVVTLEGTELRAEKSTHLPVKSFSDLEGHWAKYDAEYLATIEVVNGIGEGLFGPDLQLTRAQFAKLVVLGLNLEPAGAPNLTFTDSAAIAEWARGYVATAVEMGLIRGFDDGSFRPDDPVSRVQVAVVAARGLRYKEVLGENGRGRRFRDEERIPAWARADVELTAAAGVIEEFWGEDFDADTPATRALAAAVVRRLYTAR